MAFTGPDRDRLHACANSGIPFVSSLECSNVCIRGSHYFRRRHHVRTDRSVRVNNSVLCCAVPCRAVPCRAVLCRAVPCCAVPADATIIKCDFARHFSDLRRGPLVEDSVVGFSGDDFFNVHRCGREHPPSPSAPTLQMLYTAGRCSVKGTVQCSALCPVRQRAVMWTAR